MGRRNDGNKTGASAIPNDGSTTASASSSTTAGAAYFKDQDSAKFSSPNFEEIASIAASVAAAKAEQAIAERLAAATQAQVRASKMLAEATKMLESIKVGLNNSAEMQNRLALDIGNIKGNAVAALSMFVSFFAFITVSINVFSKAGSAVSAAALVVIFWSLLAGFNIMIGWQFNTLKHNGVAWFALVLVSMASIAAIVVMYYFAPDMLVAAKPVLEGK